METDVRSVALSVLIKWEACGQYSNLSLDTALKRTALSESDKGLLTNLVYGVIERKITLDHTIRTLSSIPFDDIEPETRMILRLGLYQLAFLDRIPDHAAVFETVRLCKQRSRGFVNALLRAFLRRNKELPMPDKTDCAAFLSVRYSVSEELTAAFLNRFGAERTESVFRAFGSNPPPTLRVNTLCTTPSELAETLAAAGFSTTPTTLVDDGLKLTEHTAIPPLPGFAQGAFFVEDESCQLAVKALEVAPGMRVLDTCACPGSKTFSIGIEMKNHGFLQACDLHANKLSLVESGAQRLGLSILSLAERDAREPFPAWKDSYDRILCDVPCSGLGVLSKKPELRYKDLSAIRGLPPIQSAILSRSAEFLKVGGKLVYSTCTLLPEENRCVVEDFLRSHENYILERDRTLMPDTDGTDGFYFAVLSRRS